jgi:hypothetical protein
MYPDYKKQVLLHYQEKAAAGTLSTRLIQPSPAQLREECKTVCLERYDRRDQQALRTFFGSHGDKPACLQTIKDCGTDKFRPLVNFLKKPSIDTEVKNIELLAWLIDFQPRPFDLGKDYGVDSPKVPGTVEKEIVEDLDDKVKIPLKDDPNETADKTDVLTAEVIASAKPVAKLWTRMAVIACLLVVFIGGIVYWVHNHQVPPIALTGHEKCMYWAGDHYAPVSCSQKLGDTLIIALDSEKLNGFKKITQPDTITYRNIGAVWYVKINGNIEFYTSGGFHPMDRELRLRPITAYIINKYIQKN